MSHDNTLFEIDTLCIERGSPEVASSPFSGQFERAS